MSPKKSGFIRGLLMQWYFAFISSLSLGFANKIEAMRMGKNDKARKPNRNAASVAWILASTPPLP
jgi:hypothetical protein